MLAEGRAEPSLAGVSAVGPAPVGDMEARFGHPVLLAETFVDPSRHRDTCYLAAGWTPVWETWGFARSGGGEVRHGRPKTVMLRPFAADAAAALAGLDEPASWRLGPSPSRGPTRPASARRRPRLPQPDHRAPHTALAVEPAPHPLRHRPGRARPGRPRLRRGPPPARGRPSHRRQVRPAPLAGRRRRRPLTFDAAP